MRFDAETALVSLPHEVFTEVGIAIEAASPFWRTMIVSPANDLDFCVPTRRVFEESDDPNARVDFNEGVANLARVQAPQE